jgi:putative restriction endonuclease
MVKLVLLHKDGSIYDDRPDSQYDFPRSYLKAAREAIGDWVIYYEPVKAGRRGYFAVAKIANVVENPRVADRFLALIEPGTYLPFDRTVERLKEGRPLEAALTRPDGGIAQGGAQQLAVRRLPEADFARIVTLGLPLDLEIQEAARYALVAPGFAEAAAPFERSVVERLTRRPYRDVVFRRLVREAYDFRCALSGLQLRNGGGRPEVQGAHIRPVERQGSDHVGNGLALSGTLHWMFDRGLISVAENLTILVSGNKVPDSVAQRLIVPDRQLRVPSDQRNLPHPANLRWHRENVFGQVQPDGPPPWEQGPI